MNCNANETKRSYANLRLVDKMGGQISRET